MDRASAIDNNSDMKDQTKPNDHLYQWTKQDTNSTVIKLESATTNQTQLGKCQLIYV